MAAQALVSPEPASRRGPELKARQAPLRRARRLRRAVLLASVAVAAGGVAALALRPPVVMTTRAVRGTAIDAIYASGTVETVDRVTVKARVAGALHLRVREGDLVRSGQVVGTIQSSALTFELQRVRAEQWAASQLASASSPQFESLEAQAGVTSSELKTARDDAQRLKDLVTSNSAPQADLDRAGDRVVALESRLTANQAQVRAMRIDLAARAAGASAAASSASARLEETEVRAPISGTVLGKFVEEGEVVGGHQPLIRIGDTSNFVLECGVDEADVARVSLGSETRVSMQAFPQRVLEGSVIEILPDADRVKKTFLVKVKLSDPPSGLRSGMTAEVNIIASKHTDALIAPGEAISSDGTAWVVRNGRVQRQAVKVGLRDLGSAEILSGLAEGDELLVSGLDRDELQEGRRVKTRLVPRAEVPKPSNPPASASPSLAASTSVSDPVPASPASPDRDTKTSAAPEATPSAATSADVAAPFGRLILPPTADGHRVFIDGQNAGSGAGPITWRCGPHVVRIGRLGEPKKVTIPCGGNVDLR